MLNQDRDRAAMDTGFQWFGDVFVILTSITKRWYWYWNDWEAAVQGDEPACLLR